MHGDSRQSLSPALRPGLAFLLALVLARGATAATFTVTSLADAGPGSLRQAVFNAEAAPGADEVAFAPGLTGTITLTSGEIVITGPLVVHGPGAGVLTVSGNDQSRIFHVENVALAAPIDVTFFGLTLTRGNAVLSESAGGAVFAQGENLTILDCVISDSTSGFQADPPTDGCGGNVAFFGLTGETLRIADSTLSGGRTLSIGFTNGGNLCMSRGTLILERSTLSGGTADIGGGLIVDSLTGNSTISHSTISGNQASMEGGGIAATLTGAALTIDSSTISGNLAGNHGPNYSAFGGGIFITNQGQSDLQIVNSTISGNHADGSGGGIHVSGSSLLVRLTTVSSNTAGFKGGSILVSPMAGVQLDHSIVANGSPQDLATEPTGASATVTADYSLIEAPGTGDVTVTGANNRLGVDPLLAPLAHNGGPTLTHVPLPGSPAINAGNPAIPSPPATDQRGFARIVGPAVDLGSVEVGGNVLEIPALSQLGLLALGTLLVAAGVRRLRRAVAVSQG
jgi:hypothetical protein